MSTEDRVRTLLDLVESHRAQQCEAILHAARNEAAAVIGQARREARGLVRSSFEQERKRVRERIVQAEARLQAVRRRHGQKEAAALLNEGWRRLEAELLRRWRDSEARGLWVRNLVTSALTVLPKHVWQIVHPADWPLEEIEQVAAAAEERMGERPSFSPDATLRAGLRMRAGKITLDGTLAGLMADRCAIEARLLHYLEGERP